MKDSKGSLSTYTESLFLHIVKHNLLFKFQFFFLSSFFHEYPRFTGQQVKGETSPYILSTISIRFTDTQTLAGLLLQRAHFWAQLEDEIENGIFGTRSLEFTLSTLALVAAVVRRMLKTRVTLGNISRVLLNLFKRLIFVMFNESSSLPMFRQLTFIFSLQFTNYGCFSP